MAFAGMDFKNDEIVIIFGPNDTQIETNITIVADIYPEFAETFGIAVLIPFEMEVIGVTSGNITTATGVIWNDDSNLVMHVFTTYSDYLLSGLYASFEKSLYNVAEGKTVVIQVNLDHPSGNDIVIMIDVNASSATGVHVRQDTKYYFVLTLVPDYILSRTNVTFGPNDTSQNVTLLVVDDDIVEYDELLTMSIMIPDQLMGIGILLGDINMTTINITDNDGRNYMHACNICNAISHIQELQQACPH